MITSQEAILTAAPAAPARAPFALRGVLSPSWRSDAPARLQETAGGIAVSGRAPALGISRRVQ